MILELTWRFHWGKPGRFSHLGKATEVLSICFLVRYAGGDHTQTIEKFYRDVGFSSHALPRNGRVGKDLGDQGDCIPKIHRVVSRKSYYVYWQWLNLKFIYFQERKMIASIISITSRSRKDQRIMWSPKDNFGPREPRGWAQSQFCVAVPPISQIHFLKNRISASSTKTPRICTYEIPVKSGAFWRDWSSDRFYEGANAKTHEEKKDRYIGGDTPVSGFRFSIILRMTQIAMKLYLRRRHECFVYTAHLRCFVGSSIYRYFMKDVGIVDIGEDAQGKTHFESKVLAGKKYGKSKMPYRIHYFQLKSSLDNLKDPFGRHPQRCEISMTCRCS